MNNKIIKILSTINHNCCILALVISVLEHLLESKQHKFNDEITKKILED